MPDNWGRIREDIKKERIKCAFGRTSIAGTFTIEAIHEDMPFPLATIWYRWNAGSILEILHMFTIRDLRRIGLSTILFNYLLKSYPSANRIITATGTEESTNWMKKMGWQHIKEDNQWVYKRKAK